VTEKEACVLEARPRLVLVGHGIGVVLLSHKVEDLDRGGVGVDECGLPIALVLVDVDLRERHRQRVDRDQRLREAVLVNEGLSCTAAEAAMVPPWL